MLSCFVWQLQFRNDLEQFFPTRLPRLTLSREASFVFTFHNGTDIFRALF